jgi:excisionase family DNA binding protein
MLNIQSVTVPRLAYSLCEAELATGLSRATLYRLAARGQLQMIKAGGRRLVPSAELERLCRADQPHGAA